MTRLLRLLAAACLILSASPLLADPAAVLDRWYAELQTGDDAAISAMLSDDAVIVLEDIGVEQTKAEFLDSLEEWRDAINGGSIAWKLESAEGNSATALACYRFPDSEMEVRETFTFSGDQIARSVQTEAGQACEGF